MTVRSIAPAILLVAAALVASGCSAPKRLGQVLAPLVADLMPHGDRDHFVYLSEKTVADHPPETSLAVEHVSSLEAPGEFQITESADGVRIGDSHWLSDDHGLSLLSEEVEGLGVRLAYDPPLLLFPQPLLVGEHRASSTGAATRLDDGTPVGLFRASVVVRSQSTRSRNPIAKGDAVLLEVTRSLEGPNGALVIHVESLNAAGIGELESVAALEGVPLVVRRSLLCGFIQGRAVGHCDELK
jgi:hypothetical protein